MRYLRIRSRILVSVAALCVLAAASVSPRALFAADSAAPAAGATPVAAPFWSGKPDSAGFRALADGELRTANRALDRLLHVSGPRTIENTLAPYNEALLHADNAAYASNLIESVHPDSTVRAVAEEETRAASKFLNDLGLNRGVYDALASLDVTTADPKTRYAVEKTLRDFRLSGVDKDEATRKKIAALREELVSIGQEFDKNIRNDSRTITLAGAADLDGLPEDYIKGHPAGPDGKISISIEYPDFFPVMSYAKKPEVRQRLLKEFLNRAYPANLPVLDRMIAKRYELAQRLGFKSWAEYATKDKMIGSDKNVASFIERLRGLTLKRSQEEYEKYLKRKREDDPAAKTVNQWDRRYYGELIRKRAYNFDGQQARPYFPFDEVKAGVLGATSQMFGLTYKRIANADVWDPSVEAYEVWENDRMIGRFFLDLHPRPGKYNHAANFGIRNGVEGVQIPEAALICNFAGGKPGDPGLMEHGDVVTFFHEFGHLLHAVFGGHQQWEPISGIAITAFALTLPAGSVDPQVSTTRINGQLVISPLAQAAGQHYNGYVSANSFDLRNGNVGVDRLPESLFGDLAELLQPSRQGSGHGQDLALPRAQVHAVPADARHPFPGRLRTSRRLLGDLLHLHVVARDLERHVQQVRQVEPARSDDREALSRHRARRGGFGAGRAAGARVPGPRLRFPLLRRVAGGRTARVRRRTGCGGVGRRSVAGATLPCDGLGAG